MGSAAFLQDLVVVLVVAAVATIAAYRLKQPLVLGYLLAGFLIGPYTPPFGFVTDMNSVTALAELGLIFLMFALGLEFNLGKLRKVGKVAIVAAVLEVAGMIAAGYYVGLALGWTPMDAIFLGCMLSMSSTTIIVKVLMEQGVIHESHAEITFGILIVEDLLAIVLIALLGGIGSTGGLSPALLGAVVFSIILFVGLALAVGLTLVPRLIDFVARFQTDEVMLVTVVGLACANALLAHHLGFSLALGAFLMGAIIAESRALKKIEHKIVPIRDLFTAVFFVAVGMLIDPVVVWDLRYPILIISAVTIVGKTLVCSAAVFLTGNDGKTSLQVGLSMGQIGEFSFIIAGLGLSTGVTSGFLYPVAVAVCAITTLLTPYLMKATQPTVGFLTRWTPRPLASAGDAYMRLVHRHEAAAALTATRPASARYFAKAVLYAAWVVGLTLAGLIASIHLHNELAASSDPVFAQAAFLVGCALTAAIVVPAAASYYRALWRWGRGRAQGKVLHPRLLSRPLGVRSRVRVRAHAMALFGLLALVGFTLLAIFHVQGFDIPHPLWAVGITAAVVVGAVVDHRRVMRFCSHLERIVETLLGEAKPAEAPPGQAARRDVKLKYPIGVVDRSIPVPPGSDAVGMTVKSLDLQGRTGAHIVGIERGGGYFTDPQPHTRLHAGDRLHVVGRPEQVEQAAHVIEHVHGAEAAPEAPGAAEPQRVVTVRLPPTSGAIGRWVSHDTILGTTGARVVSHQRRDGSPVNPSGSRYQAGDVVVLAGGAEALSRASRELDARLESVPALN
ncbi:MAG TPA: cation:proton antiporter [Candidatus Thermoplasmatota archaeon]|nr:cation:proton antiporter [Candidatus Thermoplasmatota archaeon]